MRYSGRFGKSPPQPVSIDDDLPYNCRTMSIVLTPIESEFSTVEEAAAHDRWFRAKVQASLDDQRPSTPHDQVMATMREIIGAMPRIHASGPLAR